MTDWTDHVKAFAKSKGMKFNEALKDPACSASYSKKEKPKKEFKLKGGQ
jgi:hypothetical protein